MKNKIPAIISILILFILIYFSLQFSTEEMTLFINSKGIWAPLVYIIIQIIGQIFAPLSTSALFVAGYVVFGKMAIVYSLVVWLISSFTNFYIARNWGDDVLTFFIGKKGYQDVLKILDKLDNKSLILLRMITLYVNDFASYAFGLTKISFKSYYLATIVSMLPWALIMNYIMDKGSQDILPTLIKVFLSMIPFALLNYFFLEKSKKNK